jgi:hypothetical protein
MLVLLRCQPITNELHDNWPWMPWLLAEIFVEALKAVMLFPYVRFRSRAIHHQTPWDDIIDRLEWGWQVSGVMSLCDGGMGA